MPPLTPEQLQARQSFIGGSDAASICGLNPYRSAYDVFLDKTGQGTPVVESEAMRWGTLHENTIAGEYESRSGRVLSVVENTFRREHMGCHVDRFQRDYTDREGVLEIKTTRRNLKKGECPDAYVVQLFHNLICVDRTWGTVVILIQGSELVWYDYHLTPQIKKSIIALEGKFWQAVQAKDWSVFGCD